MSKLPWILTISGTAVVVSGIWFGVMLHRTGSLEKKYTGEVAKLESTLNALGPSVTCYTLSENFWNNNNKDIAGRTITDDSLQAISVPSSLVGTAYVTNKEDIVGKYYKVNIEPGTPITSDLVMEDKMDNTLRDIDISVSTWVVGMRVGDYVDIRLTLPYGEDYIVLTHKRIQSIGDKTVKMYLTEDEWNTYQSAMVDYYLYSQKGARIYFSKYVAPGLQTEATAFYAISDRVKEVIRTNPNIVNLAQMEAQSALRPVIDGYLEQAKSPNTTVEQEAAAISAGRNSYTSDVSSDYRANKEQQSQQSDSYNPDSTNGASTNGGSANGTSNDSIVSFDESEQKPAESQAQAQSQTQTETQAQTQAETQAQSQRQNQSQSQTQPQRQTEAPVTTTAAPEGGGPVG
jgi:SAF domain protein